MQNDRLIQITTGESRKSTNWKPETLLWSELITRLSLPRRSPETLAEYLSMPKARKDELKDVGGFVGGTIKGSRRKAEAVTGRDIVTLDLDNLQPGTTNSTLQKLHSFNCGFYAHGTRKHEEAQPRLRVGLLLSRTALADEYEPAARKLGEIIGMSLCDPSTFEASRLMYWPSCCADSQYVFDYSDAPPVDLDALLGMYADWRDVTQWPEVPGAAQNHARLIKRQADPTSKRGVVGAFCRVYNICSAMEAFIPGEYEPADNSDDRYTYVGGSTTGGAVIYDNGNFLYSHHATDPCGGKLVNAFDLVRLHKFGMLDDEAKPDTPPKSLPSTVAMKKLAKEDKDVSALLAAERGKEILEDFADDYPEESTEQPQKREEMLSFLGGLDDQILTTAILRKLLYVLGITTKDNEISHAPLLTGVPKEWSAEKAPLNLPTYIIDYLKAANVKGATKGAVCDGLDLISDEGRFNPVAAYFAALSWDGVDKLSDVYAMLGASDWLSCVLIEKWLIQCVAMAHNKSFGAFGAAGVLTLQGAQNIGKTSFFREIVPLELRGYFKSGASIDLKRTDTVIQATSFWITELGELERTTWRDQGGLKAFLTQDVDQYRTPYDRKAVTYPRRTSFCATVNDSEFLVDDTGNRRFWSVPVETIDLSTLFLLSEEWRGQLWAQAKTLYETDNSSFRLTREEHDALEQRNAGHMKQMEFEGEIQLLLDYGLPEDKWSYVRPAELAIGVQKGASSVAIGRVLRQWSKQDKRIGFKRDKAGMGYKIPLKPECALSILGRHNKSDERAGTNVL